MHSRLHIVPLLLLQLLRCGLCGENSKGKTGKRTFLPEISKYIYESNPDGEEFRIDHYSSALEALSSTQSALKSVDGLTHRFKNALNDYSSLEARFRAFSDSAKQSPKEATKIFEYVNCVERSVQACELAQAVSESDENRRLGYLQQCGLTELRRIPLRSGKLTCILSLLMPIGVLGESGQQLSKLRYKPGEVIVVIADDDKVKTIDILKLLHKKEKTLMLQSVGMVAEEVSVQPGVLALAKEALRALCDVLLPASNDTALPGNTTTSESTQRCPSFLRLVGYSVGGGAAALATMVLDGSLAPLDADLADLCGTYRDRVRCVSLGPPPCVSRSIISRNVMSVVCGDDCVPRATKETLEHLTDRVAAGLRKGAGRGGLRGLGYSLGPGLLSDLGAITGSSIRQYTAGKHDLSAVSLPGRVFFVKTRKHKHGGSIRRVLRGNWQEDILWQLHEIVISKRMVEHHSLSSYIATLVRV